MRKNYLKPEAKVRLLEEDVLTSSLDVELDSGKDDGKEEGDWEDWQW